MDASQVVTCKALSLAYWRIRRRGIRNGAPLVFEHELNELENLCVTHCTTSTAFALTSGLTIGFHDGRR